MLNLPGAKEDHTEDSVLEEREKSSLGKAKAGLSMLGLGLR